METPILVTKLYRPAPRPRVIDRRHLVALLDESADRRLILVSAPAGFGKTTLISSWLAKRDLPAAWVSLDEADNDLSRFLAYLVAALQRVDPAIGMGLPGVLDRSQPPPPEAIVTALLNDISARDEPLILVLDDYHVLDSVDIDEAMGFLLDHLPPQARLVLTTREDPRLPLARLRARGEVTEIRAAELRFSPAEASDFLTNVMDLDIADADVAALDDRTEGWVAGLQLAALSMQGRGDTTGFIRDFAGDDRYIVDYLVDEVLRRQPEHIRTFLLQTSVLDRMCGSLCDAVTGRRDGREMLETLERGNLFVVPLDGKRQWYRYHHLFADLLRAHLEDEEPAQVGTLHLRASQWFEQGDDVEAAIKHAFAAEDFSRAADLVESSVPAMGRSRQETTLLTWMRALPDEVIRVRPVLSVDYAGIVMQASGDLEGVEDRLRDAERWLEQAAGREEPPAGMVVGNDGAFRRLPGQIAIYRAAQALIRGDVDETTRSAGEALELLPEDDDFGRGAASGLLGLALWTSGDLEGAYLRYTECMALLRRAGFISDLFGCALVLADIRITQGRLHDAMHTYERTLQIATDHGGTVLRGTADMHVGMSGIHLEWGDFDAALHHLQASKDLGEHLGLRQNPYRWCVAMARIREAQGDLDGAVDLLLEAERLYVGDFSPNVRPVPALNAQMWLKQGKAEDAVAWARGRGLSPDDDLTYMHEYEHVTLARILLAQSTAEGQGHSLHQAVTLLERLLQAADAGGRTGSGIEILILQALAYQALGDLPAALALLERALELAEPEGYIRVFASEGLPMAQLLSEALGRGVAPAYTRRLLASLDVDSASAAEGSTSGLAPSEQSLIEPLSPRELEVLRLVAKGLSNDEIGDRLFLALSTVKGHNREIFGKLGVQRRTEAVARARELGLL